jgi:hypothetical protein
MTPLLAWAVVAAVNAQNGSVLNHVGGAHGAGSPTSHEDSAVINPDNIRPDGQVGSHRNQVTRFPTVAPTALEFRKSNHAAGCIMPFKVQKIDWVGGPSNWHYNQCANWRREGINYAECPRVGMEPVVKSVVTFKENKPFKSSSKGSKLYLSQSSKLVLTKGSNMIIGGCKYSKDSNLDKKVAPIMPTQFPTTFPTKAADQDVACVSSVAFHDGTYTRKMGWAGAGPGANYCNLWRCVRDTYGLHQGIFKKTSRVCGIDAKSHKGQFCSHTTCEFNSNAATPYGKKVVTVKHDHKERHGGRHHCIYGKDPNTGARAPSAEESFIHIDDCACLCFGARRQDAPGFTRQMHQLKKADNPLSLSDDRYVEKRMVDRFDLETTLQNSVEFDAKHNKVHHYSQHSHTTSTEANPDGLSRDDTVVTQYNENDQSYDGKLVAHYHKSERTDDWA